MNTTRPALRIFIVDDEPLARHRLQELLQDCKEQLAFEVVGEAGNGQEAMEKLMSTPADVVLLDIRMPQMDGIELAQHLNKTPRPFSKIPRWPPAIIFTTAYDVYAIKAFELHAVDYLLKPIRPNRLLEALRRAQEIMPLPVEVLHELSHEPRKFFSIHERGNIYLVPVYQVLFLRAELKYVTVRTAEREYLLDESLSSLEKEFAARFVRIHRNCLVAKDAIAGFERGGDDYAESDGWMVKLKGLPEALPISRRQQHIVREYS